MSGIDRGQPFCSTYCCHCLSLPPDGLQELVLQCNQLSSLPATISCLVQLRLLDAEHNHLDVLPDGITRLMGLQTLLLHNNRLKVCCAAFIVHLCEDELAIGVPARCMCVGCLPV